MLKDTSTESFDGSLIETIHCPVCFSHSKIITTVPTINPHSKKSIELRECLRCHHWWHSPLPTQELLNKFYTEGSEYVVPKNYSTSVEEAPRDATILWNKILNSCKQYSQKINEERFNYLELGVGSGNMFNFFKKKAHISYGIEPGEWVQGSRDGIVADVSLVPKDIHFDLITAHDVLEHLNSPSDVVRTLSNVTRSGGVIHATFPNKDALKAHIQKGKWHMVRPFGHLHYFSKKSVEKVFEQSGWKIVSLRSVRISENSALDLAKEFNFSEKKILYRLIKSLVVGQILLGKDQWIVIATRL